MLLRHLLVTYNKTDSIKIFFVKKYMRMRTFIVIGQTVSESSDCMHTIKYCTTSGGNLQQKGWHKNFFCETGFYAILTRANFHGDWSNGLWVHGLHTHKHPVLYLQKMVFLILVALLVGNSVVFRGDTFLLLL